MLSATMRFTRNYIINPPQSRRSLYFGSITHIVSDLHFALLYPLLPLIQRDMGLSFTEIGILRASFSGASAVLQLPAGWIADYTGEFWLLLLGNVWVSIGLVGMALATTFLWLLILSVVGGLGGGFQHPLASGMVSRAYDDKGRSAAVGTVNFAGDLGKLLAPPIVTGAIWVHPLFAARLGINFGWRQLLIVVGLISLILMALATLTRRAVDIGKPVRETDEQQSAAANKARLNGFVTLSGIGVLDSMARVGVLTFIPFVLISKDVSEPQAIGMMTFVFVGGAIGKFTVGWLGDRFSTVSLIWATKGLTAALIALALYTPMTVETALLPGVPIPVMAPLLVALGIGLNGTSSILYATVAEYVPASRRGRFYGSFYTTNEIGTVIAPIGYGRIADMFSLTSAMLIMGGATALILPVSLLLLAHRFSR